ncbi:5-oxoprolinase subunit PxpA [Salinicola peritrichatus]|uniref:5-oxoprolinase subunit PxpA n=1 Tax=Salinicola peritrichatus TaxID=1267424 RepID=UPI000DA1B78F|nr:5-oxoprolinase subunit PxpA [Salinicola peritrichatus]
MTTIDLNADMGEGFGAWCIGEGIDSQILPLISAANVAAGFHAGDPTTMSRVLREAARHGVAVGVHPSFRDLVGFGRRHIDASADELVDDTLYQLGALRELASREGLRLHHFKLHGALYMHAARDKTYATALAGALSQVAPDLSVYCLAGSALDRAAAEAGLNRVHEFYADRDYDDQGSIILVRRTDALDPQAVAHKVLTACRDGVVESISGRRVAVGFQSVCFHSDTPGALALIRATRETLEQAGFEIRSPRQQAA